MTCGNLSVVGAAYMFKIVIGEQYECKITDADQQRSENLV